MTPTATLVERWFRSEGQPAALAAALQQDVVAKALQIVESECVPLPSVVRRLTEGLPANEAQFRLAQLPAFQAGIAAALMRLRMLSEPKKEPAKGLEPYGHITEDYFNTTRQNA